MPDDAEVEDAQSGAVATVNDLASRDPELLFSVIDAYFGGEITENTYEQFVHAASYLGHFAIAGLVAWAADIRHEAFERQCKTLGLTPEAAEMLERVVMIYGGRIRTAFYKSPGALRQGEDWRGIEREILHAVEDRDYIVTIAITKKNLERFTVRGGPNSMARWARKMLEVVTAIGDKEAFSERDRERLLAQIEETRALLAEPEGALEVEAGKPADDA